MVQIVYLTADTGLRLTQTLEGARSELVSFENSCNGEEEVDEEKGSDRYILQYIHV